MKQLVWASISSSKSYKHYRHSYKTIQGIFTVCFWARRFSYVQFCKGARWESLTTLLRQIVISIFDKVVAEDEKAHEIPTIGEAPSDSGKVTVRSAALDAYRVFHDLCLLTEGHKPQFLRFNTLPQPFGLEIIESVLTNHPDIFLSHQEQAHILRSRVAPLVMRSLSEKLNFPTTVRITRVLYILLRRHLSILTSECEVSLSLLTHLLEPDASQPWKRALCMEVFRGICAEPALIRRIFSQYDAKEGRKPIIRELMGAMTRLATEKPSIIGLGTQSSVPVGHQQAKDASSEQAALEAGGVAGIIGGAVGLGDVTITGLSSQWSLVRVPCIDQLDKSEPPPMPDSYIYCLTLTCINNFSEGLARFILPLTSSGDGSKRRTKVLTAGNTRPISESDGRGPSSGRPITPDERTPSPAKQPAKRKSNMRQHRVPINPLTLESHPSYEDIVISSALIEACWPAVLAACSTFLYATLDNDLYHGLVRAFQKFTQVAGVLRLATPRDALLTTLGKAAVPSNVLSANIATPIAMPALSDSLISNAKGLLGVDSAASGLERTGNSNGDYSTPSLNTRNLLCLRALLNLGIALGPTLETSWTIILETLQQADYVLFTSSRRNGRQTTLVPASGRADLHKPSDQGSLMSNISIELAAVETASAKMFESTRDFPDDAFVAMLSSLCKLLDIDGKNVNGGSTDKSITPTTFLPPSPTNPQRRMASVASLTMASQIIGDNAFTLAKMGEIAQINMPRLIGQTPNASGWSLLVKHLAIVSGSRGMGNSMRFKAAEVLNEIVVAAAKSISTDTTENLGSVQRRILAALKDGLENGYQPGHPDSATRSTELEIHRVGLEALNSILEHAGQSLIAGWEIVFDIITSVFDSSMTWRKDSIKAEPPVVEPGQRSGKSIRLIKSSFSSLELICSDFLASLPSNCILVLIDALFAFCSQKDDLNISLTTITFFWNVSDFLQTKGNAGSGDVWTVNAENERDLLDIVKKTDVNSHSALWMLLLLRLTGVSSDYRVEVRNGSIQTLFRIFDTYGHILGPQGWSSCLKIVVYKMMTINPMDPEPDSKALAHAEQSNRRQWDETIKLILGGIGTLYSNYFEVFLQQENFCVTWSTFVQYLGELLERQSFAVSTTVFHILSRVLARVSRPENLTQESRDQVWMLWLSQGVKLVEGLENSGNGIQETLIAYVDSYKPLYHLLEHTLKADTVEKTLMILRDCVLFPDAPPYFQDIEILTPLQASVLEVIKLITTDIPQVPSLLIKQLSEFSAVAYSNPRSSVNGRGVRIPTYIALSTQSIGYLEKIALKHIDDPEIYTSFAIATILKALEIPISLKYSFTPTNADRGKRPSVWFHPSKTVISIMKKALPAMNKLDVPVNIKRNTWKTVVAISGSVLRANTTEEIDEATLLHDEALDIDSFRELRDLVIPTLGQSIIEDETILQYVKAVFWCSMLHRTPSISTTTSTSALKSTEEDTEDWLRIRSGNTGELMMERRKKICYVCIDELFSLTALSDEARPEFKRLAKIAAPWLIVRAGKVLARYVADQPLRGRMPQPASQRKEIIYILNKVVELETGLETIHIDSPYVPVSSKRHLFKLFPLFTKCIAACQGDKELLGLFSRALEGVGESLQIMLQQPSYYTADRDGGGGGET